MLDAPSMTAREADHGDYHGVYVARHLFHTASECGDPLALPTRDFQDLSQSSNMTRSRSPVQPCGEYSSSMAERIHGTTKERREH